MVVSAIVGASLAAGFVGVWYAGYLCSNRRRGSQVLLWLQGALSGYGRIEEVSWSGPARLRVRLNLAGEFFRQSWLDLHLAPRQNPLHWAIWRLHRRQETLTFQANLACPPDEGLEVARMRWNALDHRPLSRAAIAGTHTISSLFIATQPSCRPQLSGRIQGVAAMRDFDSLAVSFRASQPHFSVTFSLAETLNSGEIPIFKSLRELAQGSPTSRM